MFTFLGIAFVVCLLLVFRSVGGGGLEEGDRCSFNDGSKGICKLISGCPEALDALHHGNFPENICGFVGAQSIVCCKGSTPPPPTSRPPAQATPPPTRKPTPKPTPSTQPSTATPVKVTNRVPGDISKQKCKEYAQYAYKRVQLPTLSIVTQFAYILECVFLKREPIARSLFASRHEFPHMALIGYESSDGIVWACGGSLISENYILTAAHCLKSKLGPAKYARLGITNQTDKTTLQERSISQLIPHPDYRATSKYHDIGLLRLSTNFDLNPYVRPACIQTEKSIASSKAIATVWGKVEFSGPGNNDLLKLVFDFFDLPKCNDTYKMDINAPDSYIKDGIVDDYMICAGSKKEYKDTCQGDYGGPLQLYHEDTPEIKCMYDIVGISSFGKSCGLEKNVPSVYTRVSEYLKWIEDNVWP